MSLYTELSSKYPDAVFCVISHPGIDPHIQSRRLVGIASNGDIVAETLPPGTVAVNGFVGVADHKGVNVVFYHSREEDCRLQPTDEFA